VHEIEEAMAQTQYELELVNEQEVLRATGLIFALMERRAIKRIIVSIFLSILSPVVSAI